VDGKVLQLHTYKVGWNLAKVLDAVALHSSRTDAEGSGVRWRTSQVEGFGLFVTEADCATVIEVDIDGGEGRVIVHSNYLQRAVVDAQNGDIRVVEDQLVVVGECDDGILRCRRRGDYGDKESQ
jgi:hypothetical protein